VSGAELSPLVYICLGHHSTNISAFYIMIRVPPGTTVFPYTTLFRSVEHIFVAVQHGAGAHALQVGAGPRLGHGDGADQLAAHHRSEEHTSELQSRENLVCRRLPEKKNSSLRRLRAQ